MPYNIYYSRELVALAALMTETVKLATMMFILNMLMKIGDTSTPPPIPNMAAAVPAKVPIKLNLRIYLASG